MSDATQKEFEEHEETEEKQPSTELATKPEGLSLKKREINIGQKGLELQTLNDLWRF